MVKIIITITTLFSKTNILSHLQSCVTLPIIETTYILEYKQLIVRFMKEVGLMLLLINSLKTPVY